MSDISACSDNRCPRFLKCYRAQCEKNPYYQTYFMWDDISLEEHKNGKCMFFWELGCKQ